MDARDRTRLLNVAQALAYVPRRFPMLVGRLNREGASPEFQGALTSLEQGYAHNSDFGPGDARNLAMELLGSKDDNRREAGRALTFALERMGA